MAEPAVESALGNIEAVESAIPHIMDLQMVFTQLQVSLDKLVEMKLTAGHLNQVVLESRCYIPC